MKQPDKPLPAIPGEGSCGAAGLSEPFHKARNEQHKISSLGIAPVELRALIALRVPRLEFKHSLPSSHLPPGNPSLAVFVAAVVDNCGYRPLANTSGSPSSGAASRPSGFVEPSR